MPIFEYVCQKCGTKEERLTSVRNLNKAVSCFSCGEAMKRVISPPFIHCTGAGVYKPIAEEPSDD